MDVNLESQSDTNKKTASVEQELRAKRERKDKGKQGKGQHLDEIQRAIFPGAIGYPL